MRALRKSLALVTAVAALASCGQTKMVQTTGQVRSYMIQGNYNAALATLRQSKNQGFKEQDRVAFWMNEGMLLHLTGNYAESNKVLEQAEQRAAELYTKSISKNVKAAFTSDAATDYAGEDYEKVLLNVIKSLNYLALSQVENSLVEARKINEKLALYNTKYEQKNTYNQDAFAHWLMGLLFEMERSYDDARIAYTKALEVYKTDFAGHYGMTVPSYLPEDLARAAILSADNETLALVRTEFGAEVGKSAEALKTQGEILLVHFNGEGPSKSDFFIDCVVHDAANWYCDAEPGGEFVKKTKITIPADATVIKVAFPELHIHTPQNSSVSLAVNGVTARSEVALPISHIAVKALADKMQRIFRDAILRVVTKTLSTKAAGKVGEKTGGKALGWLADRATSATMQATEEADKRCWSTLPARIEVARVMLPPGVYDLNLGLPRGKVPGLSGVKVEAGKRTVVTHFTLP